MRRLCLIALLLAAQPARADLYDDLSGVFESFDYPGERCAENPVFVSFSPDRRRVAFAWADPVPSYTGAMITGYGGTVVDLLPDGLIMLRDEESRLDPQGQPVLWIMKRTVTPEGFCWTRKDWPEDTCLQNIRCPSLPSG